MQVIDIYNHVCTTLARARRRFDAEGREKSHGRGDGKDNNNTLAATRAFTSVDNPTLCNNKPTTLNTSDNNGIKPSSSSPSHATSASRSDDHDYDHDHDHDHRSLTARLVETFLCTWDLGLTAFGGPPVHFSILHRRFVHSSTTDKANDTHARLGARKKPWISEQTYAELFAVSQSLPGPASTKMLLCTVLLHNGLLAALLAFVLWSLPGAIGMYALSLGVQRVGDTLPGQAYALLTGLNAATVGVVAGAAVGLAEKGIGDSLTRGLVILGACAGMCYSALWFFPTLIAFGGVVAVGWDLWGKRAVGTFRKWVQRKKQGRKQRKDAVTGQASGAERQEGGIRDSDGARVEREADGELEGDRNTEPIELQEIVGTDGRQSQAMVHRRPFASRQGIEENTTIASGSSSSRQPGNTSADGNELESESKAHSIPIKAGITLAILFLISFVTLLVVRSTISNPPRVLDLFTNMYLAGTIIFGGGPVVIPLLREYVVQPGWVSPRDFLLGLAIIQAFPGPNFNFVVYLGALSLLNTGLEHVTILGSFLAFIGIFTPGLILAIAFQSLWKLLRKRPVVISALRGINATAIGLVFTAVYRLWQIGFLSPEASSGQPLGTDPWWVVVSVLAYSAMTWYRVPAPVAIMTGGALGLAWYGVVND